MSKPVKTRDEQTAVERMFSAYVAGNWRTMSYTREKASHAWWDFWFLLISSGFAFERRDLVTIRETYSCSTGSRRDPDWYGVGEGHYSLAVRCGNLSFAYAYEELYHRIPFIGIGVHYWRCAPSFSNHATRHKSAGRLVLSSEFSWKGQTVKVTSFQDSDHALIACSYYRGPIGSTPSNIKRRFKITNLEFKEEMSRRRKVKDEQAG